MAAQSTDRRTFIGTALVSLATLTMVAADGQRAPEVPNYSADVPPGATLWGVVVFTGDEPVEMTIAAGKSIGTVRGRFGGERLKEYSWRNESGKVQQVIIRATALAGNRELHTASVEYRSDQNVYVGFGRRATPDKVDARQGGYPYDAVFVGFIVYE